MATRTAVAGDDFDPRKLIGVIGLGVAGYGLYKKFNKGQKINPAEALGFIAGLWGLFGK